MSGFSAFLLLLWWLACCAQGALIHTQAQSAFHQIYAGVWLLTATMAFVGAAVLLVGGEIVARLGEIRDLLKDK